jgi:S-adenosylmethionine decarboxylase
MHGCEWIVDAYGCAPSALADPAALRSLFAQVVLDLSLTPVGEPAWHQFPGTGGVTGLLMLSESHLACHTFPEHGTLCLNLFCCRPRDDWDFDGALRRLFGASSVRLRRLERPFDGAATETPLAVQAPPDTSVQPGRPVSAP